MTSEELTIITNMQAQTNKMFMQLSSELKTSYKRIEVLENNKTGNNLLTLKEVADLLRISYYYFSKTYNNYSFSAKFIIIGKTKKIKEKHIRKYIDDLECANKNIGTLASS